MSFSFAVRLRYFLIALGEGVCYYKCNYAKAYGILRCQKRIHSERMIYYAVSYYERNVC